ncbi:hypothetical protein [Crocosphaera sp.]|uniref:hypothetical protein n=1 Tax=Crocosphaera sp. TaxID=2729996 RepID=UPI00257AE44B|nr:hypothetical protein [Crocosphaera sp.]NQZ64314.1 hypothetical protein [Crocosphaera sp.]
MNLSKLDRQPKDISVLKGTIHPDGFFTIGRVPNKKKGKQEADYDHRYGSQFKTLVWREQGDFEGCGMVTRVEEIFSPNLSDQAGKGRGANIGLSSVRNSDTKKTTSSKGREGRVSRRGSKGITQLGRRRVIDAVTILEQTYGRKRLGFGTLTIPSMDDEAMAVINRYWHTCIESFQRYFRRHFKKLGVPSLLVGVTEVQMKRLENHGQFANHYHFVYPAKDKNGGYYVSPNWVREVWGNVLNAVLKKYYSDIPLEMGSSVDLQMVKKSAKNYLSKYISKGKDDVKKLISEGYQSFLPRQWWGMTKAMRDEIKMTVINISSENCYFLLQNCDELKKMGVIKKLVASASIVFQEREVICGYWGVISLDYLDVLIQMFY